MGWSLGYDGTWDRHIGYGVPAYCDHPKCNEEIDRGLAYVCCGEQPYGGDDGCGLYFCEKHRGWPRGKCSRCRNRKPPFDAKPEHPRWARHVLTDESWAQWREENPEKCEAYRAIVAAASSNELDERCDVCSNAATHHDGDVHLCEEHF